MNILDTIREFGKKELGANSPIETTLKKLFSNEPQYVKGREKFYEDKVRTPVINAIEGNQFKPSTPSDVVTKPIKSFIAKQILPASSLKGGTDYTKKENQRQILTDLASQVAFAGGVKDISKADDLFNQTVKKISETEGANMSVTQVKELARQRMSHLINYNDQLRRLGYSAQQAEKIGWQEAKQIIDGKINPQTDMRGIFTKTDIADFESDIARKNITDVKKKVNIIDYMRTPQFVLEKIGLGDEGKLIRTGWEGYKSNLKDELTKIAEWQRRVPEVGAEKAIFRYLDGKLPEDKLSSRQLEVANEIKAHLKTWATKLGLPEEKQISNYITHIFEVGAVKGEFDPEIANLIEGRVAGSVYDPFLQKRINKPEYVEDVWRAMEAYVKRGTRKVNMDPALSELKKSAKDLDTESYKYVQRLSARINLRPTEADKLIDNLIKSSPIGYRYTERPTAYLSSKFRTMVYKGALGMNFGSALRNLTQGVNTYAKLGEKYTLIGYKDLLSAMATKNMDELYRVGVLDDALIVDRKLSAIKGAVKKADEMLFSMFDMAEKINRGSAYFGAKKQALAKGMNADQAVEYAKQVVRDTQFQFSNIDTPVALSSDIAKTLLQFQSYNVKQLEFLTKMISKKDFAGILRYVAASVALTGTVGKLFGMKVSDMIPFSGKFSSPIGEVAKAATGLVSSDEDTRAQAKRDLGKIGALIVPGGVQIKKTLEGVGAVARGYTKTPSGKVKYPVSDDPINALRALIFGQYAVPEAREYYKKGRNPLGKEQSEQFKTFGLPYYQATMKARETKKSLNAK